MQVKSVKFELACRNEEDERIISYFYKSLDFSLFTQIDTIEIADSQLNFDDILQNQNLGIKKLIISKDLCIRLENSNDFNDFILTSLKVFPTLKIIKFDEVYSPLIF